MIMIPDSQVLEVVSRLAHHLSAYGVESKAAFVDNPPRYRFHGTDWRALVLKDAYPGKLTLRLCSDSHMPENVDVIEQALAVLTGATYIAPLKHTA